MSGKRIFKNTVDYLVYLFVRVFICVVQSVRVETAHRAGKFLAWLCGDVLRVREKVVFDNICQSFPEKTEAEHRAILRQMWEHLFLLILEIAHAPRKIHETNWRDYFRFDNGAAMVELLNDDRPTIVVTAHYGNFEMAGYALGLLGYPTYSVARTLDNPYLDRFLNQFRNHTGQYLIPKNGGFDQIMEVMDHGRILALLADQYAGPRGCWVDFFGRPASAYKSIALLAFEHKSPIMLAHARRDGNRPLHMIMEVGAIADPISMDEELENVRGLTQWYTSGLEEIIRKAPGQYWWLHRRWKDTRKKKKKKVAPEAEKKAA